MTQEMDRRSFLSSAWKVGLGFIAVAGAWTTWDLLRPRETAGSSGPVRTVPAASVTTEDVVEVAAARSYLTREGEEVIALSERCPHLSCRVPFCESSGQFECPCHGSFFNRIGEYRAGPSPRGMDRHPTEIVDGIVVVDPDVVVDGPPKSEAETINEPVRGPSCVEEA